MFSSTGLDNFCRPRSQNINGGGARMLSRKKIKAVQTVLSFFSDYTRSISKFWCTWIVLKPCHFRSIYRTRSKLLAVLVLTKRGLTEFSSQIGTGRSRIVSLVPVIES